MAGVGAHRSDQSVWASVVSREKCAPWTDVLIQVGSVIITAVGRSSGVRLWVVARKIVWSVMTAVVRGARAVAAMAVVQRVMWFVITAVVCRVGVAPARAVARRGCAVSLQRAHRVNSAVVAKSVVRMVQTAGS